MKILSLETATDTCSAALYVDGACLHRSRRAPARHGEFILPLTDRLLAEAQVRLRDLDVLAFGRGPGSFTGTRIAAGVAQGLACAADLPVAPVSTLAGLAQGIIEDGDLRQRRVLCALDARMGEVYWGIFEASADDLMRPQAAERVCPPTQVPLPAGDGWLGIGNGWRAHRDALRERLGGQLDNRNDGREPMAAYLVPLALDMHRRGQLCTPSEALPVYLRDRVAEPPA